MSIVNVHIQYSENNVNPDKIGTFVVENGRVFKEEGDNLKAHLISTTKFSLITLSSPLIALARLVRSVAFACTGDFERAGREFVGGFATPFIATACLAGTLAGTVAYLLDSRNIIMQVQMRRTYAYFEAWVNNFDLNSHNLPSYGYRVSNPIDFIGHEKSVPSRVWTTAPCMQPVLEHGFSRNGGLYDAKRMAKIYPFIKINGIERQGNKVVIQSEYMDKDFHYVACDGLCEHARSAQTYCCYRIETAYDRVLCCEVGQGNCISTFDHNDNCGVIFCHAGCVGICCCTEKNNLVGVSTCLV